METQRKPKTLVEFQKTFPQVWKNYTHLRNACDSYGPLDRKTRELIKIAIEVAHRRHGGLVAHITRAKEAGAEEKEILHAIVLATPLVGLPVILDAFLIAEKELGG